ncbi:hypothetical protein HAX54_015491 [Datura stramonium]|uniref:Uncharacterized protein n=1 Tax=Datura stramonium TaxID=4076 RepID=A0ABS8RZH5_DATST|nr:hypothetical protein [Datura stramonium]
MSTLACYVDADIFPPLGYAVSWDNSLIVPEFFPPTYLHWQTSALTPPVSISLPDLFSDLYRVDGWDIPYFSVNSSGDTIVGEIKAPNLISNLSNGEACVSPMSKKSKQKILLAI